MVVDYWKTHRQGRAVTSSDTVPHLTHPLLRTATRVQLLTKTVKLRHWRQRINSKQESRANCLFGFLSALGIRFEGSEGEPR